MKNIFRAFTLCQSSKTKLKDTTRKKNRTEVLDATNNLNQPYRKHRKVYQFLVTLVPLRVSSDLSCPMQEVVSFVGDLSREYRSRFSAPRQPRVT